LPKHGPGSTAEGILGNKKYYQSEWTERLQEFFPMELNLIPNYRYIEDVSAVTVLEPGNERPVRVVHVPKTLDKPRIIAMEPVAMQYVQQALLEACVSEMEKDELISSFISLEDQTPNQRMALEGSRDGSLATLDLSEASDRVSNQLVIAGMSRWPHLSGAVQACRSTKADVPGFGVLPLAKFASMGSALCFPVECMVFLTIIFVGIENALSRPLSRREMKSYTGKVRVYGDDLVVPVEFVPFVIDALESYGFKVNDRKSFWTGMFRESCGKDYYAGEDVTVFKLRQSIPQSRRNAAEIAGLVAFRNHAYKAGYWKTVKICDQWLESLLRHFPAVAETSPALGKTSFLGYAEEKVHRTLHKPLVKAWKIRTRLRHNPIDGVQALLKWFLKRGDEPFADKRHLERSGRPDVVSIELGMVAPF
jgi:hypothetical protein